VFNEKGAKKSTAYVLAEANWHCWIP